MKVRYETEGPVAVVTIDRPEVRNAVDEETAEELFAAFENFNADSDLAVAVLTGSGGHFCAGFDLKALAAGTGIAIDPNRGPMGPTYMQLDKPVLAAIEGHAVAGGLELALWCDLRIASRDAVLGVFNRRFGVPLVDGGTIRLPRMIGQGRALDLILSGRAVGADEALTMGLVERVVEPGTALDSARDLALHLSSFPQRALRHDRRSVYRQWSQDDEDSLRAEQQGGMEVIASGESLEGARRFAEGDGRHGS
ncbi:MAG TPA: crotonase/enoyl-CoA hydratase family protein [Candidatus Dormibacteraeota bacterium]|nr:crotonase/enoyl-CoA hydratase family protein [Candidatus Dormibacteraeota bacterium]